MPTQSIGPWDGGLNLTANRDLSPFLRSNELGIAKNVELTSEGFVESRVGFKSLNLSFNDGTGTITILGTIYIESEYVTVVQVRDTDCKIFYIRGDKTAILKYTFTGLTEEFSSVLAINESDAAATDSVARGVFLFSKNSDNKCYRLELIPRITDPATPVLMNANLAIPKSTFSFNVKGRVFLIDGPSSTIYWSAVVPDSLFFNEDEVDGGSNPTARALSTGHETLEPSIDSSDTIVSVEFINNNFYFFKKSSSFILSYQADPAEDGYLRKFNNELGAFDSTIFRNTIVVINNRGVFTVEGTEFIDIQQKLNLRFETSLDNRAGSQAFITEMNGAILIGYKNTGGTPFFYLFNGENKGWTQWDFEYADPDVLASPGSNGFFCQYTTGIGLILFTTFDSSRLVYCEWKPSADIKDYAMDGPIETDIELGTKTRYIPAIDVQSKSLVGDSVLSFKKLYRSYVRLYISDIVASIGGQEWTFSVNYNNYYFIPGNPEYVLIVKPPGGEPLPPNPAYSAGVVNAPDSLILHPAPFAEEQAIVYRRTYQIPIQQHRVKEFAFQLSRTFSKLTDVELDNPDRDRPIEQGFYFLLSGFWADYQDKARI